MERDMEEWRKVRKTKEVKHVIESPDEVEEQFDDDYIFEINGKSLVIHQKNVGLIDSEEHLGAVGRIVWDASVVLSKYLESLPREMLAGKKILELGSGAGLLGLSVAAMGGHVTLTDYYDMDLLHQNTQENFPENSNLKVKKLKWGVDDDIKNLVVPYELVIGSDIVYYPHLVDPLIITLNRTCDNQTIVFLALEKHKEEVVDQFVEKIKETFNVQEIPLEEQHPMYRSINIVVLKLNKIK